jgi:hypothetical protein
MKYIKRICLNGLERTWHTRRYSATYFDAAILEFGATTNLICGFDGPFLSPNLTRKVGFILE